MPGTDSGEPGLRAVNVETVIERYTLPEMAAVFDPVANLRRWLEVELLVIEGWAIVGRIPQEVAVRTRKSAPVIDAEFVSALARRESELHHDVAAFVDVVEARLGNDGRWFHYGITSSDVVDTANSLALRDARDLVVTAGRDLFDALAEAANRYRETVMVGRTHGVHAEPILLGAKLALLAMQVSRAVEGVARAGAALDVGMISGAVGSYATVPPEVEAYVCESLGLSPVAASQFMPRDLHADFVFALARATAAVEAVALQVRLGHQTEVGEMLEGFAQGQKGSSAMPHKRNPITSEKLCGVARLARSYVGPALEDIALWHEHDLSHSCVERVVFPNICTLAHYSLTTATSLVRGLSVNEDRLAANLALSGNLLGSQALLLALINEGKGRDEAYKLVQEAAVASKQNGTQLAEEARRLDPSIRAAVFEQIGPVDSLLEASVRTVDALASCWAAQDRTPTSA